MNIEQVTLGQFIAVITFVVGGVAVINRAIKPVTDYNKRLDRVEQHQDNDNKRLDSLENDTKQILLSVNVLLQHSIDNNHTDALKKRKSEMDQYLITR